MTDLCPHGDYPACCLDCIGGKPPERPNSSPRVAPGGGWVIAQFEGHCPGCDDTVAVGEKIIEFSPGRWGHLRCAD